MEYGLALAVAQGAVRPADFEGDAIHRPAIRALTPRVKMRRGGHRGRPAPATTVTVRLHDGRTLTASPAARRGTPANPMSPEEADAKFLGCAVPVLGEAAARDTLRAIAAMDGPTPAAALIAPLTPPAPAGHIAATSP